MAKPHDVELLYCNHCRITTRQFVASNGYPKILTCMRCGTTHNTTRVLPPERCTLPPPGWRCTRQPGHDGPCAALPEGV